MRTLYVNVVNLCKKKKYRQTEVDDVLKYHKSKSSCFTYLFKIQIYKILVYKIAHEEFYIAVVNYE